MIIIVYGVSGCGKTTVGKRLATEFNVPFLDADNFHPSSNITKMASGKPLTDTDRWPWIKKLVTELKQSELENGAILACSALKESYRERFNSEIKNIQWVHLVGEFETIARRMKDRSNHFMPEELLRSQFDTLEPASYGLHIRVEGSIEEIVRTIVSRLHQNAK